MDAATLLTFAAALFVAAATPGPGVAAIVARALGVGFRATVPMALGLMMGDLVWLSFAAFGLAVIAATFGAVFVAIKYAGAAYLMWLAVKLWRAPAEAQTVAAEATPRSAARSFLAGVGVTLGNPKPMIFYLALLPAIVDLRTLGTLGFVELALATAAVLAVVVGGYAALASAARGWLASPRARRAVNRVSGTAMGAAAVGVAAT